MGISVYKGFGSLLIRLTIALLAAHFIVVHDADETWSELFTKDYYYLSLMGSFVIAVILIEYIYFVTYKLNRKYKNARLSQNRMRLQFFWGFILATLMAVAMAAILFWLNDTNMIAAGYFNKLFVSIMLFIFAVNLACIWSDNHRRFIKYKLENPNNNLKIESLPAIIYHDNKSYFAIDFEGNKDVWPNSLNQSLAYLDAALYFKINRHCIIHRAVIAELKPLHGQFVKVIPIVASPIKLVTSRRTTTAFKEWLMLTSINPHSV